jgi:hypothetical protein
MARGQRRVAVGDSALSDRCGREGFPHQRQRGARSLLPPRPAVRGADRLRRVPSLPLPQGGAGLARSRAAAAASLGREPPGRSPVAGLQRQRTKAATGRARHLPRTAQSPLKVGVCDSSRASVFRRPWARARRLVAGTGGSIRLRTPPPWSRSFRMRISGGFSTRPASSPERAILPSRASGTTGARRELAEDLAPPSRGGDFAAEEVAPFRRGDRPAGRPLIRSLRHG